MEGEARVPVGSDFSLLPGVNSQELSIPVTADNQYLRVRDLE